MLLFDATNEYYRFPGGAVPAGTPVRFRLELPRCARCEGARLVISRDGFDDFYVPMSWEDTDGETEHWTAQFTASEPAPYFYRFEYDFPFGKAEVFKEKDSFRGCHTPGEKWQLTVYDGAAEAPDGWQGGVIYQIFPDRFCFSGKPKTGVPGDRVYHENETDLPEWRPDKNGVILNNDYFRGDFEGITSKLGYLAGLGVTAIYLNPIGLAHSNHRYDTADYLEPDPLLGTVGDFEKLCKEAHRLNIKILLDGVFSHTGSDSKYFNKNGRYPEAGAYSDENSPYRKWYSFRDDGSYKCWWNIELLPETNENEPSFRDFITGEGGVIDTWLGRGADGYRLDVADELPDGFLDAVREAVKRNGKDKLLLGEVWEDATNKISHGGRRRFLLGRQLDSVMNYPVREAITDFLLFADAPLFARRLTELKLNYPPQALNLGMNLLGTHDTVRILSLLSGMDADKMSKSSQASFVIPEEKLIEGKKLLKAAFAMLYTLPGIPSVYYGDEAGAVGGKDPFNRCFFPWGRQDGELTSLVASLGKMRKEYPVLRDGGFYILSDGPGCVAYLRYKENEKRIAVIVNRNPETIIYNLNTDMREMIKLSGENVFFGSVAVPPLSAVILTDRDFP